MDDVRFYNRALTATEITSAYGGALVDTTALVMQLNFTAAPGSGVSLTWQCTDAILQSADSVNGPYTDVPGAVSPYSVSVQTAAKFYRYRGHTPRRDRHQPVSHVGLPHRFLACRFQRTLAHCMARGGNPARHDICGFPAQAQRSAPVPARPRVWPRAGSIRKADPAVAGRGGALGRVWQRGFGGRPDWTWRTGPGSGRSGWRPAMPTWLA